MVTPGTLWNIISPYWYFIPLAVVALAVGVGWWYLRNKRATKSQVKQNLVKAIIFDGNIRSPITTVSGDEIKGFKYLRPKKIKNKMVYLLQPVSLSVITQKPSGNGEHAAKEEHAKEAATTGKRKAK